MSELLTQCPHCQTSFKVSETQIGAAEGLVRCGSCLGLFSASLNLIRVKPPFNAEEVFDEEDDDESLTDDDDISLGDMDLDFEFDEDENDENDEDDEDDEDDDEDEEDDDESYKVDLDDAPRNSGKASFTTYEEYQENADLFADLPTDSTSEDGTDEVAAGRDEDHEGLSSEDDDADAYDEYEDEDEDEDEDDYDEEDEVSLSEDEFNSAGLMDLEDEELEYEYSRIVVSEDDFATEVEEPVDSNTEDDAQPVPEIERRGREKARLRRYLSGLQDDEALEPLTDADLDPLDEDPLTFEAGGRQRKQLQQLALGLLSVLLLAGLLLQFVNHHLEALSQRNSFARFMPLVCGVLECPEPEVLSPLESLYSQELLVRTHPRTPDALEVSFIFRNDAAQPQPFPGLELSFRNTDNELLANRLFRPQEYLPPELRALALMPADSSVQIRLELLDPGADAVNYTMAFRAL